MPTGFAFIHMPAVTMMTNATLPALCLWKLAVLMLAPNLVKLALAQVVFDTRLVFLRCPLRRMDDRYRAVVVEEDRNMQHRLTFANDDLPNIHVQWRIDCGEVNEPMSVDLTIRFRPLVIVAHIGDPAWLLVVALGHRLYSVHAHILSQADTNVKFFLLRPPEFFLPAFLVAVGDIRLRRLATLDRRQRGPS